MALTTDLEAYYKLDTDNATQPDSANSNDLSVTGATFQASAKINGGYSFDGTDDFMSGTVAALASDTSFTINFWIDVTAFDNGYAFDIFDGANPGTDTLRIRLLTTGTKIQAQHYVGNVEQFNLNTGALSTGTYYMVTVRSTGSHVDLFINGSSVDDVAASGIIWDDVNIGRRGSVGDYGNFEIDEIGLWSRNLSNAEITELYNSGSGLQYPFPSDVDNAVFFSNNF